jgi:hypothetical protein
MLRALWFFDDLVAIYAINQNLIDHESDSKTRVYADRPESN